MHMISAATVVYSGPAVAAFAMDYFPNAFWRVILLPIQSFFMWAEKHKIFVGHALLFGTDTVMGREEKRVK